MGTTYAVTVSGLRPDLRPAVEAAVDRELELVDTLMSTYRPDSELSRLNRHPAGQPFPLSPETSAVLATASEVSALTGGAFDVTVGSLVGAWGFGAGRLAELPAEQTIRRLREASGWQKLRLDPERRTAVRTVPGLQCDLSAVAKGYATDRIAEAIEGLGHRNYLAEVGGEVRVAGHNPEGGPWRIGVERPDAAGRVARRILQLRDTAVATSGDYRSYREVDGHRFSHVVDPRTGRPSDSGIASATVMDASAARADALATAFLVLGEAEGIRLAEREGLPVLLIVRGGPQGLREAASSHFRARMSPSWN